MEYKHGPDSFEQDGVPRGSVTKFHWKSQFYRKETVRDYWVYVPSQYDETTPSGLMVQLSDEHNCWLTPKLIILRSNSSTLRTVPLL